MAAELISFSTGLDWIRKLWGILDKRREKYRKELEEINNTVLNDPLDIAQYYIEPECQDSNPADHPEEDYPVTKSPILKRIDQFFQFVPSQLGGNQMIILSDAGMGKTALLTMLKLLHLTAFWSPKHDCVLKKLGKTTLDEISKIENKRDTILLLDSLDEDTEAFGKVRERLIDILKATQHFHKTIITCRTQFFSKAESDPFNRPGLVTISGFVCPAKYLSFFSVQKVEEYLIKRFPKKFLFFTDKQKIEEAQSVIAKMGALRCRPMLLSYIENLMAMPQIREKDSEYHVYDALVRSWLIRQESKPDAKVSAKDLLRASIILAAIMQIREKRSISEQDLDALIKKIEDVLPITKIDIKGKSLINRNSDGDYRFSHFSIQEFLVAKMLLEKPDGKYWFTPKHTIRMTDFIVKMIAASGKVPNFVKLLDFNGINNLKEINLSGSDLSGKDFSNTDLSNADLRDANLRGANLSNVKLDGAKLIGFQFESNFSFRKNLGLVFVYISPGEFMMGSPKDEPERLDNETLHKVTLTRGFYMQITTVTVRHWKAFASETNYKSEAEVGDGAYVWTGKEWKKNKDANWKNPGFKQTENSPVTCVTWNDAQAFITWLNKNENSNKFRLPTEAEWEYACRSGTITPFYFGRCLSTDQANYNGNYPLEGCPKGHYRERTTPVGSFPPNDWRLYDMHGNVYEWCQDCYGDYPNDIVIDPIALGIGSKRVLRGGSWGDNARFCRSADRDGNPPDSRSDNSGFRLVRDV